MIAAKKMRGGGGSGVEGGVNIRIQDEFPLGLTCPFCLNKEILSNFYSKDIFPIAQGLLSKVGKHEEKQCVKGVLLEHILN